MVCVTSTSNTSSLDAHTQFVIIPIMS
uniref:Uncharacterized protein n=1 Tax=Anguilla anguilla TaxID=7936 RepID=A0A0E9V7C8_ANGAN